MGNVYHCTYGLSRNKQALEIVMAARDHDIYKIKALVANDTAVVNDPGPVSCHICNPQSPSPHTHHLST